VKPGQSLLPREREIYELLVGSSLSIKEIAARLDRSEALIKIYSSYIYRKFDVRGGRIELMHREIERLKSE
jgi:DNA-binding NarL/FixJ family response regulator